MTYVALIAVLCLVISLMLSASTLIYSQYDLNRKLNRVSKITALKIDSQRKQLSADLKSLKDEAEAIRVQLSRVNGDVQAVKAKAYLGGSK